MVVDAGDLLEVVDQPQPSLGQLTVGVDLDGGIVQFDDRVELGLQLDDFGESVTQVGVVHLDRLAGPVAAVFVDRVARGIGGEGLHDLAADDDSSMNVDGVGQPVHGHDREERGDEVGGHHGGQGQLRVIAHLGDAVFELGQAGLGDFEHDQGRVEVVVGRAVEDPRIGGGEDGQLDHGLSLSVSFSAASSVSARSSTWARMRSMPGSSTNSTQRAAW